MKNTHFGRKVGKVYKSPPHSPPIFYTKLQGPYCIFIHSLRECFVNFHLSYIMPFFFSFFFFFLSLVPPPKLFFSNVLSDFSNRRFTKSYRVIRFNKVCYWVRVIRFNYKAYVCLRIIKLMYVLSDSVSYRVTDFCSCWVRFLFLWNLIL